MSASFSLSPETLQLARGTGTWRQQFFESRDPSGFGVMFDGGDITCLIYEVEQPEVSARREYRYGTQVRDNPPIFDDVISSEKDAVERWFIRQVGEMYRSDNHLRQIILPYHPDQVKPGFEVVSLSKFEFSLRRADGTTVNVSVIDDPGPMNIVEYSQIADLPVRDLARSYLDPEGFPLLHDYLYYRDQPH